MIDGLRLVSRTALGRDAWNAFVDASDDAWLWHRSEFQEALATWPRRNDRSFALIDPNGRDRVQAVVPVQLVRNRLGLASIESFGGPAFPNSIRRKHRIRLFDTVRHHLAEMGKQVHAGSIAVGMPPLAPNLRSERCPRVNPLIEAGFDNCISQTWLVDLSGGDEAVWGRMEGRARTAVRKAEKAGVAVRVADRPNDIDVYYSLHRETYERTGVRAHPKAYFEAIWRELLPQGLARVWIAELNGDAVAAENFAVYKGAAWYWTGAATTTGLDVEANSMLQWHAMRWMMCAGVRWYDTGEAFPQARSGKLKGLSDFKRSFGGELSPVFRGTLRGGSLCHRIVRAILTLKQ
jgi:hypothetical protein